MAEYTPTTEVVKDACTFPRRRLGEPRDMTPEAFDRWLAAHDRAVSEKAWDEGYGDCLTYHQSHGLAGTEHNPYRAEATE